MLPDTRPRSHSHLGFAYTSPSFAISPAEPAKSANGKGKTSLVVGALMGIACVVLGAVFFGASDAESPAISKAARHSATTSAARGLYLWPVVVVSHASIRGSEKPRLVAAVPVLKPSRTSSRSKSANAKSDASDLLSAGL